MLQQAQMAINIARSTLDQRRSCMRIRMAVPADVTCPSFDTQHHTGLVRDISTSGAFFYSNFAPELTSEITIDLLFPAVERRMKVTCHGVVVRVEPSSTGGATGIAVHFRHHDVTIIC